jgi:hypothetical protein
MRGCRVTNEGSDYPHFVTRSLSGIIGRRLFANACMIFKILHISYLLKGKGVT